MEELLDTEYKATEKNPLFGGGTGIDSMTWNETCRMWKENIPGSTAKALQPGGRERSQHLCVYKGIKFMPSRKPGLRWSGTVLPAS